MRGDCSPAGSRDRAPARRRCVAQSRRARARNGAAPMPRSRPARGPTAATCRAPGVAASGSWSPDDVWTLAADYERYCLGDSAAGGPARHHVRRRRRRRGRRMERVARGVGGIARAPLQRRKRSAGNTASQGRARRADAILVAHAAPRALWFAQLRCAMRPTSIRPATSPFRWRSTGRDRSGAATRRRSAIASPRARARTGRKDSRTASWAGGLEQAWQPGTRLELRWGVEVGRARYDGANENMAILFLSASGRFSTMRRAPSHCLALLLAWPRPTPSRWRRRHALLRRSRCTTSWTRSTRADEDAIAGSEEDTITTDRLVALLEVIRASGMHAARPSTTSTPRAAACGPCRRARSCSRSTTAIAASTRASIRCCSPIAFRSWPRWWANGWTRPPRQVRYGASDVPRSRFITWAEAREMADSGLVEFARTATRCTRACARNPQGGERPPPWGRSTTP